MDRLQKAALLTRLIQKLREQGSWCGETHIQKAVNFVQDLAGVPIGFNFVLYKHGPFSFDLRDELTALRADDLLTLEPQSPPYGPRVAATDRSEYIQSVFAKTLAAYDDRLAFVADKLGGKNVTELERLATALFVTRRAEPGVPAADRVKELRRLKSHISSEKAEEAIMEIDQFTEQAGELFRRAHF